MTHMIKVALVLLASVAAYYVYGFTSLVAPLPIAVGAAGSLVGTYIGLAFVSIPDGQRRNAQRVAWSAMLIEAVYGTLYVLSVQAPALFVAPPVWALLLLSVLHGGAFSVIAFFVSLFVVQQGSPAAPQPDVAALLTLLLERHAALPAPASSMPRPQEAYPAPVQASTTTTKAYFCPRCERQLTLGQYGAACRNKHCKDCKGTQ